MSEGRPGQGRRLPHAQGGLCRWAGPQPPGPQPPLLCHAFLAPGDWTKGAAEMKSRLWACNGDSDHVGQCQSARHSAEPWSAHVWGEGRPAGGMGRPLLCGSLATPYRAQEVARPPEPPGPPPCAPSSGPPPGGLGAWRLPQPHTWACFQVTAPTAENSALSVGTAGRKG